MQYLNRIVIRHVLKKGIEVPDVAGHVVTLKDHEVLYQMITGIQKKEEKGEAHEGKN